MVCNHRENCFCHRLSECSDGHKFILKSGHSWWTGIATSTQTTTCIHNKWIDHTTWTAITSTKFSGTKSELITFYNENNCHLLIILRRRIRRQYLICNQRPMMLAIISKIVNKRNSDANFVADAFCINSYACFWNTTPTNITQNIYVEPITIVIINEGNHLGNWCSTIIHSINMAGKIAVCCILLWWTKYSLIVNQNITSNHYRYLIMPFRPSFFGWTTNKIFIKNYAYCPKTNGNTLC